MDQIGCRISVDLYIVTFSMNGPFTIQLIPLATLTPNVTSIKFSISNRLDVVNKVNFNFPQIFNSDTNVLIFVHGLKKYN